MDKKQQLLEIWEKNGFPSTARLWAILRQLGLDADYNKKEIEKYIAGQSVSQLHHRPVRTKHSHITTTAQGVMYCIDLLDMTAYSRDNDGVKWLLLVIDIFSRVAVIVGVKNKTAPIVAKALEEAFDQFGQYPQVILSDQGSEFKGATSKFLAENKIIHRLADVGDHRRLGIVDRFSGVVKNWIAKYMTYHQSKRYIDALPDLLENYNSAPHSGLGGLTPNDAWDHPSRAREYHYQKIQKAFAAQKKGKKGKAIEVGDWVRVLKLRAVFDKGYNVKYSLTPHKVVDIKGLNYVLDNGRFYRAARLLKVPAPEETAAAPVVDVGKEARRERKKELLLQQDGVDPVKHPEIRRSARERKPTYQVVDEDGNRIIFSKYK